MITKRYRQGAILETWALPVKKKYVTTLNPDEMVNTFRYSSFVYYVNYNLQLIYNN